jgi:hypothetical protein
MRWIKLIALLAGVLVLAAACAEESDPSAAIEGYLQAWVEGDAERMASLSCAAWESQVRIQSQSFAAAEATLDGLSCARSGDADNGALVTCEGKIVMDYNGEIREWELETYSAVQEGGDWRFCGEAG